MYRKQARNKQPIIVQKRYLPPAEIERRHNPGHGNYLYKLPHPKGAELHAAVFSKITDYLRLALRQVEGRTLGLRHGRGKEYQEAQGLRHNTPVRDNAQYVLTLRPCNVIELYGAVNHYHAHYGECEGQFIRYYLGRRPDASQERPFVIRRPPGQYQAVYTQRSKCQNEQDAHAQIYYLKLDV